MIGANLGMYGFDSKGRIIKHVDWRVLILKNNNRQIESGFLWCTSLF